MAAPTLHAVGTLASGTGNVTPVIEAHAENDVLVLKVETQANQSVAAPTEDWIEFTNSPQSGGSAGTRLTAFWQRSADGATPNPTITDPGDHACAVVSVVRGCKTTGTPYNITKGGFGASSTSISIPGETTTADECLVMVITTWMASNVGPLMSGWTNANLASIDEDFDAGATDGNGGGIAFASGVMTTAGNYGTTTVTSSVSVQHAMLSIAFEPAEEEPDPDLVAPAPTVSSLRAAIISLVSAIVPTYHSEHALRAYRNEGDGNFQRWATTYPNACFRRFQVRDTGERTSPETDTTSVTSEEVAYRIMVAYPKDNRLGRRAAIDRDRARREDAKAIVTAVGRRGWRSFDGSTAPDACPLGAVTTRIEVGEVEFLVVVATFRFDRRRS